ncbi:MAG TPA: DUF4276 family protein [Thermoflexia bacterium]|nr:DUF4276 family protein [Thermoflexia bacterium]
MNVAHVEFLVEEPSMEAFLRELLPRLLGQVHFSIRTFQCKDDLLKKLPQRLRGYAWYPENYRIVVVVDRDDDDCHKLKQVLEQHALAAGLPTRTQPRGAHFTVINRIVIEELEAWYFGDWEAVRKAYPWVKVTVPQQAGYRDPDAIKGGTWEAFERVLQRIGYCKTGLRKIDAARKIALHIAPYRNTSRSFQLFRDAIVELIA